MRDLQMTMSAELLDWYDSHAREMPWRVSPAARKAGQLPDPYHVWLSEIMLQQTTVSAVKSYFEKFIERWPRNQDLAAAVDADVMAAWAGLGYYARARNLLKCARIVTGEFAGVFPRSEPDLLKLPGIGPYTAAAIAAIAFDQPATVLDGNVERVMARLHLVETPLPAAKQELRALAQDKTDAGRPGDYAQAVMDLGATICTPRNPSCGICPWATHCGARAKGSALQYPHKVPKVAKPTRVGVAYVLIREDGAVLLERRPGRGLLGGMLSWPGSEWAEEQSPCEKPMMTEWQELPGEVRHTFTHFHLRLTVLVGTAKIGDPPLKGEFVTAGIFDPTALPTVMRKVWNFAK